MRRSSLTIPLLVLLAVLTLALPAAARKPIAIGIANPDANGLTALDNHIGLVGQTPRLWALWSDWGSRGGLKDCVAGQGNCAFPTDRVVALQQRGVTPVVWWQPTNPANPLQGFYERYDRTLNGFHDAYITQWARDAKAAGEATGKPIILRYAHEATGYWFPWSIGRFDNTKENYKAAWSYVWNIFRARGRTALRALHPGPPSSPTSGPTRGTSTSSSWASRSSTSVRTVRGGARRARPLIRQARRGNGQVHQAAHHHRRVGHGIPGWRQGPVAQEGLQELVREAPLHPRDHVPRHGRAEP